jgi:hypothetical protein
LLAHEATIRARLDRLDRDLADHPNDRRELEDAALDDIMALVGE